MMPEGGMAELARTAKMRVQDAAVIDPVVHCVRRHLTACSPAQASTSQGCAPARSSESVARKSSVTSTSLPTACACLRASGTASGMMAALATPVDCTLLHVCTPHLCLLIHQRFLRCVQTLASQLCQRLQLLGPFAQHGVRSRCAGNENRSALVLGCCGQPRQTVKQ